MELTRRADDSQWKGTNVRTPVPLVGRKNERSRLAARGKLVASMICLMPPVATVSVAGAFAPFAGISTRQHVAPKQRASFLAVFGGDDESTDGDSGIGDLSWRVDKQRLEEANTKRFLKAGPRFLPYEECCKWVQAWNRWDTEEEWENWIMEGEKRNSYIPARPAEYYGKREEWISWDHFLGKEEGGGSSGPVEKQKETGGGNMGTGTGDNNSFQ